MSAQRHVIVGAGLAGAGAAAAIREAEPDASITVLGEEAHEPYERPGLSKDYLQGESDADSLLVHERGWYDEHDVTLRTEAHVDSIDRSAGEVVLAGGERLGYDRLLLATGSAPRRLPVDGIDLDGVLTFRTREDSDAVKAAIASGDPLVVVGAGWIGLEVASAARAAGVDVTVVHDGSVPLGHVVGDVVGQRFAELARSAGVRLVDGTQVAAVRGDGRVQEVELSDGQRVPASTVVLGVGITPRTELAEAAGLRVDDGVLVDGSFRTEDDAVFAVGDVARAHNAWVGEPVRLEHYAAASDGGPIAGRSMAGALREGEQWSSPPFFWSDQFGAGLEYRGWADPGRHHVVVRASAPASETGTPWFAFWHDGGRLVAGLHVDGWDDADTVKDLVTSRAEVDVARLADPQVPLGDVRV